MVFICLCKPCYKRRYRSKIVNRLHLVTTNAELQLNKVFMTIIKDAPNYTERKTFGIRLLNAFSWQDHFDQKNNFGFAIRQCFL